MQPDQTQGPALAGPVRHVVMMSGGTGSWGAAKRVAQQHGTDGLTLLFTDVLMEDGDLYRFLIEGACDVFGEAVPTQILTWWKTVPEFHQDREARIRALSTLRTDMAEILPQLVWIADGRDPWTIYRDVRMLGSSQRDPCSKIGKREIAERWLKANCDPAHTVLHLGFDWTEIHRFDNGDDRGALHRWGRLGWTVRAPLCERPMLSKVDVNRMCLEAGIVLPLLTRQGFAHNNCGGECSKGGQAHYVHLLRLHPDRYAHAEGEEEGFRAWIGRDVAMLKEQVGKDATGKPIYRPLTLRTLRERIQAGGQYDLFDFGGCGCFITDERDAA